MRLAAILLLCVFINGCSGTFLGNPSKTYKYEQPDLRKDETNESKIGIEK